MSAIVELRSHMASITHILLAKGYDSVEVRSIAVHASYISVSFKAYDDFQSDIPTEYECHHGYYLSISEPTLEEVYESFRRIPSRQMRELQVLARQTAGIGAHMEGLQSEQAKAFAQAILDEVAGLHSCIEDLRG